MGLFITDPDATELRLFLEELYFGYVTNSEITAKRFLEDIFSNDPTPEVILPPLMTVCAEDGEYVYGYECGQEDYQTEVIDALDKAGIIWKEI